MQMSLKDLKSAAILSKGLKNLATSAFRNVDDFVRIGIELKDELTIVGEANYPMLKMVDLSCGDLSLASLWSLFQVHEINSFLTGRMHNGHHIVSPLTSDETRGLTGLAAMVGIDRKKSFVWDFGFLPFAGEESSQKRVVKVVLENIGKTDLEWKFEPLSCKNGPAIRASSTFAYSALLDPLAAPGSIDFQPIFQISPK